MLRALRPGQTLIPFSVGKDVFQLHAAVDAGGDNGYGYHIHDGYQNRNALFCYGLSEKAEIDAAIEIRKDSRVDDGASSSTSGLSTAAIGLRYNICDGGVDKPSLGAECILKLPWLSADYKTRYIAPRIMVAGRQNAAGGKLCITGNLGFEFDGVSSSPSW